MKLHLNYTPPKPGFEINHGQKLLLTGSCFSENIGSLLNEYKFATLTNAAGILFNPLSIFNNLMDCIQQTPFNPNNIIEKGGEFFSFLHHSSVNDSSKEKLAEKIDQINADTFKFIKEGHYLIITFGSAYYYKHHGLNACVANCHKQPGTHFEKKLLSVTEVVEIYDRLIARLSEINSGLKIIFTVSPVKYLKDGVVENNLSKATLLLSVNQIVQKNVNCFYFPAYDLVIDDLRDYRFYKEDMAHPNSQAIKYVWEKFSETYFNDKTKLLNEKISQLNAALKHKTLHNNSEESLKFQKHIEELVEEIKKLHNQ
jgi:hypothetical protein